MENLDPSLRLVFEKLLKKHKCSVCEFRSSYRGVVKRHEEKKHSLHFSVYSWPRLLAEKKHKQSSTGAILFKLPDDPVLATSSTTTSSTTPTNNDTPTVVVEQPDQPVKPTDDGAQIVTHPSTSAEPSDQPTETTAKVDLVEIDRSLWTYKKHKCSSCDYRSNLRWLIRRHEETVHKQKSSAKGLAASSTTTSSTTTTNNDTPTVVVEQPDQPVKPTDDGSQIVTHPSTSAEPSDQPTDTTTTSTTNNDTPTIVVEQPDQPVKPTDDEVQIVTHPSTSADPFKIPRSLYVYKKHKCSICDYRSNYRWLIRRHEKFQHKQRSTVDGGGVVVPSTTPANPKYRSYNFTPSREHDFNMEKVYHSYIAGYQFHKMIMKTSSAPMAMRTILNISDAIHNIKYIENDEIMMKYEKQRQLFKEQGKVNNHGEVDELLLFHGTSAANLDKILSNNFDLDANPSQQHYNNETRHKNMMFGRGVYFSEIPSVSLMYGNGLLLCKVMLGACDVFKPRGILPPDIAEEFDSREIQDIDNFGAIHVVKNPNQILPYTVIQLKKQSLTSQFVKPQPGVNNVLSKGAWPVFTTSTQTPQNIPNTTVKDLLKTSKFSPTSSSNQTSSPVPPLHWRIVNPITTEERSGVSCIKEIEKIMELDKENTCKVCMDQLNRLDSLTMTGASSGVKLNTRRSTCGNKHCWGGTPGIYKRKRVLSDHSKNNETVPKRIKKEVEVEDPNNCQVELHQCSCSNCQNWVKTGNMPTDGQMMWTKRADMILPGYKESCGGTIVIKYVFNNGVQDDSHPHPGKPFYAKGFPRHSFLPDNEKGQRVLRMMITAFQRRLTFTIGRSITRGEDDCVVWNGIEHKTVGHDNGSGHGYPDPEYLDRVIREFEQYGITFS